MKLHILWKHLVGTGQYKFSKNTKKYSRKITLPPKEFHHHNQHQQF